MSERASQIKETFASFIAAQRDCSRDGLRTALVDFAPKARFLMCYPFGEIHGGTEFFDQAYTPLLEALPDLERRDMIVMAGTTPEGQDWLGAMGNYSGTFSAPFLDIPPTGHIAHMRYL